MPPFPALCAAPPQYWPTYVPCCAATQSTIWATTRLGLGHRGAAAGVCATHGQRLGHVQRMGRRLAGGIARRPGNVLLALVGVHVIGVIVSSRLHHENLVRAMFTGRKRGDRPRTACGPCPAGAGGGGRNSGFWWSMGISPRKCCASPVLIAPDKTRCVFPTPGRAPHAHPPGWKTIRCWATARAGFAPARLRWTVRDGWAAEREIASGDFVGVVLDLGLPAGRASGRAHSLRARANAAPHSGADRARRRAERIAGLDDGATTTWSSPWTCLSWGALARLLRRATALRRCLRTAPLTLDPAQRQVPARDGGGAVAA